MIWNIWPISIMLSSIFISVIIKINHLCFITCYYQNILCKYSHPSIISHFWSKYSHRSIDCYFCCKYSHLSIDGYFCCKYFLQSIISYSSFRYFFNAICSTAHTLNTLVPYGYVVNLSCFNSFLIIAT